MGPGKLLTWSQFNKPTVVSLLPIGDHEEEPNVSDLFASCKPKKVADMASTPQVEGEDDVTTVTKDEASCSAIFSCPEEGCVMSYQRYSSLEQHL